MKMLSAHPRMPSFYELPVDWTNRHPTQRPALCHYLTVMILSKKHQIREKAKTTGCQLNIKGNETSEQSKKKSCLLFVSEHLFGHHDYHLHTKYLSLKANNHWYYYTLVESVKTLKNPLSYIFMLNIFLQQFTNRDFKPNL